MRVWAGAKGLRSTETTEGRKEGRKEGKPTPTYRHLEKGGGVTKAL